MKKSQLSGSLRANVGKKATKAIRKENRVPCVLYGIGEQICFSVRSVDMEKLIFTPHVYKIELDIDGTKKVAIIQDKQMHPITDRPLHVDFLELSDNKPVKVGIPTRIVGRSRGVLGGGVLSVNFRYIQVEGLPGNIPEEIEVDITPLGLGDSIHIRDLAIEGIKVKENPGAVVVSVVNVRGAVEDTEEDDDEEEDETEEAAEPSNEEKGEE